MRRRLMLAMVGLVAVVLLIAGVGTLLLTRNAARNQAQQQLVQEARSLTQSKLGSESLRTLTVIKATLTLDEFPGESFQGTIVRDSDSIDLASRTLNVEVDVDNAKNRIRTGAYVFVHLKSPHTPHTSTQSLTIPANTLLFRSEGLRVGVVRSGRAELVPITIGRDFGATVEVVTGLQPTDQVIVNPSDSLTSGRQVQVSAPQAGGSK